MPAEASSETLRARYYDWCSAKIVERIFQLSLEEVWYRAVHVPAQSDGVAAAEEAEAVLSRNVVDLVRSLAEQVARELHLPAFEEWVQAYRQDPHRFDQEILTVDRSPAGTPAPNGSEAIP
jgi:hypothetical protein